MASRTKSFFDADPKNNKRYGHGQWKRNGSNRPALSEAPTNIAPPPPPQPPIPATAEAKLKLRAFQFVAGENINNNTTSPPASHPTTFPCTPGARLPLADLIGDCDATIKEVPVEHSPVEHIGWIPNSSNELLTPNRRRKRKRAKSSSPPSAAHSSSQPRDALASFPDRAHMKTPAADPTADLWQRYNGKPSGEGSRKMPEISSLAFNASPRPLETPVKGGGLRRWVSTGNDWPSSKHKKRCSNGRASVNVWQDQTGVDSASRSKVASMVQRIQESLATQRIEMEHEQEQEPEHDLEHDSAAMTVEGNVALSSSSPPPEVSRETLMPPPANASPVAARHSKMAPLGKERQSHLPPHSHPEPRSQSSLLRRTESGGMSAGSMGDPLHPAAAARLHLQSKAPLPAYKRPSITKPPPPPKVQQAVAPPPVITDLDEFGDAFDLDDDDLTELLSQKPLQQRSLYDIPEHPNPPPLKPVVTEIHGAIRQHPITLDDDDDGDEFGDDDLDVDSFAQAEFSATQAFRTSPRKRKQASPKKSSGSTTTNTQTSSSNAAPRLQRYIVKQVVDSEYTNPKNGRRCEERILLTEDMRTKLTTAISLRGSWTSTAAAPKNVVHVTHLKRQTQAPPSATPLGQIVVDDSETSPFLILHPDHMLSATTVADSFDCVRKAVLQDRVKATSESSKAMVYGSILHEVFQLALSANRWDAAFLKALVERTIESHLEGLWELGMGDTGLAREEITAKMGELSGWANIFVAERPGVKALVDERQGETARMSVSKLIAIEEHVWSPQFGLKGNIDATVQTTLAPSAENGRNRGETKLITPFEVKTGRTTQSPAHMAQTALYTLLLSDRYDVAVESGILYYLESSAMMRVKPPIVEIRAMVQQRNRVSGHIFAARNPAQDKEDAQPMSTVQSQAIEESDLPQLLRNPFKCGRCYARQSCFAFHALVENGTADSAGMIDDNKKHHSLIWGEAVGHLGLLKNSGGKGDVLKKWFTKWDKLLTFEEGDQARYRKELWTMTSAEREAAGRCFGQLVLQKDLTVTNSTAASAAATGTVDGVSGSGGKINRFTYVFARAVRGSGGSFAEGSALTMGEAVVVSGEQGQWALANGYVTAVSRHDITVAVDRKLGKARQRLPGFDEANNQSLRGTMTVGREEVLDDIKDETMLYRLDKDEFSNGLALIRNNLVTLMSDDPMHTKLREQILFGAVPSFESPKPSKQSTLVATQRQTQLGEMNEDQRSAVAKVLAAQDYALILGMPGTGKTTTIAHIIRALLAEGKSILLTSFTHTAVDNILLKIREIAPKHGILRLGVPSKINKQVQNFCLLASTPRNSFEAIEQAYMETKVVATTCMGTNHAVFQRRTFDVCIVDEASQITLPTILGPLLRARKFVLVGDHYQLPPLVQNKAALEGGLDVSLFRQLSEEQPGSVVALGRQYRMCKEIMSLSNELIYHGKLQCGNESVANRELEIPNPSGIDIYHSPDTICDGKEENCWLKYATSPRNKVVFANTDPLGNRAMESLLPGGGGGGSGGGEGNKTLTNPLEATLAAHLVLSLLAQGVPASEIGIITLYRSQLALIRHLFRQANIDPAVEIDSADRFQGRDKEVIVLSMVRSNATGVVGRLLEDWRRVNVACTRARSKFLVLGSRRTLGGNELLGRFLGVVEREGWGVELRGDEDLRHGFWFGSQNLGEGVSEKQQQQTPMGREKRSSPGKKKKKKEEVVKRVDGLEDVENWSSSRKASQEEGEEMMKFGGKRKKVKLSPKIISRNASQGIGGSKMRKVKERVAIEIFEDLTGEEFC